MDFFPGRPGHAGQLHDLHQRRFAAPEKGDARHLADRLPGQGTGGDKHQQDVDHDRPQHHVWPTLRLAWQEPEVELKPHRGQVGVAWGKRRRRRCRHWLLGGSGRR